MFRKAQRKQAKLKIGLSAPSGAGKTYSALLMAYGMCGDWEKIAVIDTENGSAELYSHLGGFSVCPIAPPFTPKKYIAVINEAVSAGFEVLIIDSLSHAWSGEGGLLEMKDRATKASNSGNSFTAWRDVTPEHNRLVDAILQSDIDVILTLRAKSDYVITDDNGKKSIKKVGLAPIFRDGLEYELTVFFDLSQEHIATASKDRTELFDGLNFKPTAETGKQLSEWRNGGAAVTQKIRTNFDIIKEIISDSEFVMDDVNDFIVSQWGKEIDVNDLTEAQFNKLVMTLRKNIKQKA